MKLTYDPAQNIAYLRLHEKKGPVDTIRVSDELNVDMAPDGTVYGIELLNANEQLQTEADGSLVMINKSAAKRKERLLAVHEEAAEYKTVKRKISQRKK